jgi:hypothetical protein
MAGRGEGGGGVGGGVGVARRAGVLRNRFSRGRKYGNRKGLKFWMPRKPCPNRALFVSFSAPFRVSFAPFPPGNHVGIPDWRWSRRGREAGATGCRVVAGYSVVKERSSEEATHAMRGH